MYTTNYFFSAAAAFSLIGSSIAVYDASSDSNVVVYWGSGSNQLRLRHYCEQPEIDVINIAFMNIFPAQGNGYPGVNFGNACYGDPVYVGPGSDHTEDHLYQRCPTVQEDIPYCQANGKKILLSLGGGTDTYGVNGVVEGNYFAEFLWGAYGPYKSAWVEAGGLRPLDRGYDNTAACEHIDIDGFDFDIEFPSTDNSLGYITMINRLRELFLENPKKEYLITGSPQCPIPDENMGAMILGAQFDALWIQFYNNGANGCTARNFADHYPNNLGNSGFNYDAWVNVVNSGLSAGAKLYIGLLGGPGGSTGAPGDYLSPDEAQFLIDTYQSHAQFGGVMLWEATVAEGNTDPLLTGETYQSFIKHALAPNVAIVTPVFVTPTFPCPTTSSTVSSSTTKATTTSSTMSSTTTQDSSSTTASTTSETSTTTTSTTATLPTTSSTSSQALTTTTGSSTSLSTSSSPSSTEVSSSSSTSTESLPTTSSTNSQSLTTTTESSTSLSTSSLSSSTGISTSSIQPSTSSTSSTASLPITSSKSSTSLATATESSTSTDLSASSASSSSGTVNSSSLPSSTETPTSAIDPAKIITSSGSSGLVLSTPSSVSVTSQIGSITSSTLSVLAISTSAHVPYQNTTMTTSTAAPITITETRTSTNVHTITSCAPTVTDCPLGSVVTDVVTITTTYCPGDQTPAVTASPVATTVGPELTTSTVYTTKVYTITSCAPSVTNCPAKLGSVTTEIISLYTTVCPVAQAAATATGAASVAIKIQTQSAAAVEPTTTISSTKTTYITVTVAKSSGSVSSSVSASRSASASSWSESASIVYMVKTVEVIPTPYAKPTTISTVTASSGLASATTKAAQFTGAAGSNAVSGLTLGALAVVAAVIFV